MTKCNLCYVLNEKNHSSRVLFPQCTTQEKKIKNYLFFALFLFEMFIEIIRQRKVITVDIKRNVHTF